MEEGKYLFRVPDREDASSAVSVSAERLGEVPFGAAQQNPVCGKVGCDG